MDSEQFLRVADLFAEPAVLLERDGSVLAANRAVVELGWTAEQVRGRGLGELCSTPAEAVADYLRLCSRNREPLPGALTVRGPDGRDLVCRCHGAGSGGPGKPGRVLLRLQPREASPSQFAVLDRKIAELTEEIRRRTRLEDRLREQGQWLAVTLASIGDAVATTDAEGRVTLLNPVAEGLCGWPATEAVGRPLEEVLRLVDEQGRPIESPVRRVLAHGAVVGLANHTLLVARDGRETPIDDSAAPIRDPSGRVAGVVLVFRDVTERKRAEAALRDSEGRFRALMEQAPFSVQVFAPDGRTLRVNRAWEELWGVTLDQIPDYNVLEDPQLAARGVLPLVRRAFAGEAVAIPPIEYDPEETLPDRTRHADSRRWVSAVAYPLRDTSGTVREVVVVHDDITARHRAEAALEESEQRFRLLADTIPQLAWMARPDGHIFWYNRRWYEYTGTTPEEMAGWGWQSVHDPGTLPQVVERWKASLATGEAFDMVFPLRGADGVFRPFLTRVNPLHDATGRVLYWFGTNTDISEHKRAEDASRFLAEAGAALAAVTDYHGTLQRIAELAVPRFGDWCVVDLVDGDGSLQRVAVEHVDRAKVELAGELHRRYPPNPGSPIGPYQVLRTGEAEFAADIPDEVLVRSAHDAEHLRLMRELGLASYLSVPMKAGGRVLGVLSFVTAESGRRYGPFELALAEQLAGRAAVAVENARLYAELVEADRRKDEFLATLAHELRNPLAPIRSSLEILGHPQTGPVTADRARAMIERQVQHLVRLVDDLLDVSRVMRGKIELQKEPLDLGVVVTMAVEAAQPTLDAMGHELEVQVPPQPVLVEADPVRLAQVVGNLLTNAAKYTPRGGHLRLRLGEVDGRAVLSVRDDGIGIASHMLNRVFDLFVQADSSDSRAGGGLGIGLTLVRSLVEMHGGSVEAHSDGPGRGSEFVVRLPLARAAEPRAEPPAAAAAGSAGVPPRSVLVVDDNVDAGESLGMLLQIGGHDVRVVHGGEAALRAAAERLPQLVLLDLGMPGMDSYEVARRLRELPGGRDLVVVALTGWGQEEDRRRTTAAGFDLHLVKPVEPEVLRGLLLDPRVAGPRQSSG